MKSITLHGIDDVLYKKMGEKSKEFRQSQNKTVKKLLENSISINESQNKRQEFSSLFGKWTMKEKEEFDKRIEDIQTINESDSLYFRIVVPFN